MKTTEKRKIRRLLTLAVILLTVVGCAVALYARREKKPVYMTVPVHRGTIEQTVLASGTMESDNMVSVGAQVSGQLKTLKVDLGDTVKAGQLVAEIDSLPQQNALRTKNAALDVVLAQKKAKEATLHQAEQTYARQTKMLKGEASSREDFDAAEANLHTIKAEIAALDAQIEQARIAVDNARLDLGYTKISSPIDGIVVAVVTKEGQTVNANQTAPTIIKVARLDRMSIRVEISEADVVKVKPGQRVYFTILGEPDKHYPATLKSIEPAPESVAKETSSSSTSTSSSTSSTAIYYIGILDVPNVDGKLRISMTAQVNIVLAEANDVLLIPSAALGKKNPDGRYMVQVESAPGQIVDQSVQIGMNTNVDAEVLDGLQDGQKVVIGIQSTAAPVDSSSTKMRRPPPPGMM